MEDYQIIEQFMARDRTALAQAEEQYGDACRGVAERILGDDRAAAVIREALLRAWDAIPQKQPKDLKAYLMRLTRNLAVDHAAGDGECLRALRELERCIPRQDDDPGASLSAKALQRAMDEFLGGLAPDRRRMFVLRYWYLCSAEEIASRCGGSPDRVRGVLKQVRGQLRAFLLGGGLSGVSAVQLLRAVGSARDRWILEAGESNRSLPLWVKGAVLGLAVCCTVALGMFLVSRGASGEESQPPQSSGEAPAPSDTASVVSVSEPEPSTTVPAVETTAPPTETSQPDQSAPPGTEPSIRDSAAYQKLLTLWNADQFDPVVLEGFARWIENEEDFLETYPEKWKLKGYAEGGASLFCHSPLNEDYSCRYYYIWCSDFGSIFVPQTGERLFTSIPREEIAAKVYGAEDPIGVDDGLKEEFVDYIMDSDWFPWSTMDPEFRTTWYFDTNFYGPDHTECITLFVDVWMPGMDEGETVLCSLFHNGTEVREGANDTGLWGGVLSSSWDNGGG